MKRPGIKNLYQVYKRAQENTIFIGVGPDKVAIEDPTPEMEEFIKQLDGTKELQELCARFKKAPEWLSQLKEMSVIEDYATINLDDYSQFARWNRQINYFRLHEHEGWTGLNAQKKLAQSRVVVVGTGAGGTTLLRFLNTVGIGTLEAVDFDNVELPNLATHSILNEADVGHPKLEVLRRNLLLQNSKLNFITHQKRLTRKEELAEIIQGADFFLHAFDRPRVDAIRWGNWASLETKVPFAGIGVTDKGARVGPLVIPGKTACCECLGLIDQEFLKTSEAAALMGPVVATIAGIMVLEIVKVVTGMKPSKLEGRSLYINTSELEFNFNEHKRNPHCPACSHLKN